LRITVAYNVRTELNEAQAELLLQEDVDRIVDSLRELRHHVTPVEVSGKPNEIVERLLDSEPDLVFNVAEGTIGSAREAFYPGIYEQLGMPFTGGDASLLHLNLDKQLAMTGASLLRQGKQREVYALCRPSGHHAGPRVFGGYCYFNNSAAAADMLSRAGRVAILDGDYHHGNGTQEFFQERKDVFTSSIHGDPDNEYPYFWGYADERGVGQAAGTNLNLPLPLGSGNDAYFSAVDQAVEAIRSYDPDFLIIGAGFDTHETYPIGGFKLTTDAYSEVGARLARLGLPTLICQEGGYNTDVLGTCVLRFLTGFLAGRSS
jgi:acetoin utilization deacetylase AcuC-like enzyme